MTSADFRAALDRSGLTQREFAEMTGTSIPTVNRWATGKWPAPKWAGVLLDLLNQQIESEMTTYTIAFLGDLLVACQPDGHHVALQDEIDRARAEIRQENWERRNANGTDWPDDPDAKVRIVKGLILTDDEPEDDARIVYRGHELGWLTAEAGTAFNYAVKPA